MSNMVHSRNPSEGTEASSSSSYRVILDHVMQYPGSYEIPLRTMYTLNVAQRAAPLPPRSGRSRSGSMSNDSRSSGQGLPADSASATAQFTANLMSQLSQLPSQPCSLPPSFIITFVRRCFHPSLPLVDFPQALTALDYLKDLETRRRKEVKDALARLGVRPETIDVDTDEALAPYPGVAQWIKGTLEKSRKVEGLYSHVYVGLRRWILINEMSLLPFNKHNCNAMLNTLYPPIQSTPPTSMLDAGTLLKQREGFFKYIQAVDKSGPRVLKNLMEQGRREGETMGWGAVQDALDKYLCCAKKTIDECSEVISVDQFPRLPLDDDASKRKGRKVDSGVSFGSDRRPSTSASSSSNMDKPLPAQPGQDKLDHRHESTLEKITREFKKMRLKPRASHAELRQKSSSADLRQGSLLHVEHPLPPLPSRSDGAPKETKPRNTLKKMRSLGALNDIKHRNGSVVSIHGRKPSDTPDFDPEFMRQQRMIYEASQSKHKTRQSS